MSDPYPSSTTTIASTTITATAAALETMARPKSAAQIRRMQKRAEARGEVYVAPARPPPREQPNKGPTKKQEKEKKRKLHEISRQLEEKLKEIDENEELTSKNRRSAKRKAEAVAAENAEMSRTDFLEWCEQHSKKGAPVTKPDSKSDDTAAAEPVSKRTKVDGKDEGD